MYREILDQISQNKHAYSRETILVCNFTPELSTRIGDTSVFISEYVLAKILGYLQHLKGHPEVTKNFLTTLPEILTAPKEILVKSDRPNERYIICGDPTHRVVLEIKRNNNVTEINTIHKIRESTLRKLEEKCKKL